MFTEAEREIIESLDAYKVYSKKGITDFLPGHIREEIAKVKTAGDLDTQVALKYLFHLLKHSKEFWEGRGLTLSYIMGTFPDVITDTVDAGAGAMSYSYTGDCCKYTENGTPSGAFSVLFRPALNHAFRVRSAWIELSNQDVAVVIELRCRTINDAHGPYLFVSESLDNAAHRRQQDNTGDQIPPVLFGNNQLLEFDSAAAIDASTTALFDCMLEIL